MQKKVIVDDPLQPEYSYELSCASGKGFDPEFTPDLSPKQMLQLGVFGGSYFEGYIHEFPEGWFEGVVHGTAYDAELNYYQITASQPLSVWQQKGWIYKDDPRGWFQWYCRYYLGRRIPEEDIRQIKRWKAMRRHIAQIKAHCTPGDQLCRRKQRQALLHWAYDSRKM